ncbi:MAG TPA: hypothetical protein PKW95_15655 [bacterium]|nr:hypothetical protein [bacterium]
MAAAEKAQQLSQEPSSFIAVTKLPPLSRQSRAEGMSFDRVGVDSRVITTSPKANSINAVRFLLCIFLLQVRRVGPMPGHVIAFQQYITEMNP